MNTEEFRKEGLLTLAILVGPLGVTTFQAGDRAWGFALIVLSGVLIVLRTLVKRQTVKRIEEEK